LMSGCPGGPGDANANWVTTAWPPEAARVLEWQWSEQVIPYWRGLVREAREAGVVRLCLELHGQQNVFNVATLFRLREAVGPMVGANFDPSHLFWMAADPLVAAGALGEAIYHVHAKDTRINAAIAAVNGQIDVTPMDRLEARAWSYVTLGDGHDAGWWRRFCAALRAGHGPAASAARSGASHSTPPATSWKHSNTMPSSSMLRLKGGIEPGVMPPMSAWCAREAT